MFNSQTLLSLLLMAVFLASSTQVFSSSNSNTAMDIDHYLLQASDRAFVSALRSDSNNRNDWQSGWIDSPEFRIQHQQDEKNNSSETYRLRLRPKYGSEREAEQSFYSASTQQHLLQASEVLASDLFTRYSNVIDLISLQLDLKHLKEKNELLQLEMKAERSLTESGDFKAEKLQDIVLDIDHTNTQITLTEKRAELLAMDLNLSFETTADIYMNRLILPVQIDSTIKKYQSDIENVNAVPEVKMAKLDKNLADARLKIHQAKSGFGVELLEVKYVDKANSAIGFTVGFRLPGGNDARSVDRYLDKSEAESKYRLASNSTAASVRKKLAAIEWDYSVWQSDKMSLNKVKKLMLQPSRSQNPALITGLRKQLLSLNIRIADSHVRLLKNYIELLNASGLLAKHPTKNWLVSGLPELAGY